MPTIEETIEFIKKAHAGQFTKAGEPYWTHPVAVMNLLPAGVSEDVKHAALLHDVLEDTKLNPSDISAAGYSFDVVVMVSIVTRPTSPTRASYIDWIRFIVSTGNLGAMQIKLADNKHNSDPERIAKLPEKERDIVKRYQHSMKILEAGMKQE